MRVAQVKVYSIHELDESAKEKALNWLREDPPGWDAENRDTLNAFEKIFPVKISSWEYGYRDYINWTFEEDQDIEELAGIRLLKYLHNNYYDDLFRPAIYWSKGPIGSHSKKRKSRIKVDNCCPLTGYCIDDAILKPIFDFMKKPEKHITFYDLMSDCLQSWIYAARDEYEYSMSDEALIDLADANEYEFDEYGNIF